jgi:hypothetical protein
MFASSIGAAMPVNFVNGCIGIPPRPKAVCSRRYTQMNADGSNGYKQLSIYA